MATLGSRVSVKESELIIIKTKGKERTTPNKIYVAKG